MRIRKASDLLRVKDVQEDTITLPAGDETLEVRVRGLTAREQVDLDSGQAQEDMTAAHGFNSMINVIMFGTIDEAGKRLFDESWREWLEGRSEDTLVPWFKKIMVLTTGEEPAEPGKPDDGDVSPIPERSRIA